MRLFAFRLMIFVAFGISAWAESQTPPLPILGPDAWFRPRDSVIYYLDNPKGETFTLALSLGDMNIYLQGKREAILWVIGPDGKTLLYERIADDGITSGNFRFKDGLADVYCDTRYRAWAEESADLPLLANKARSPLADEPAGLSVRRFSFPVPAAGQGVYRVAVLSCWDHWISLDSKPLLQAAIASGAGPLALRPGKPFRAWVFNPAAATRVGIAMLEEVKPYQWKTTIQDGLGKNVATIEPHSFYNFAILPSVPKGGTIEVGFQPGENLASFHIKGAPPLLTGSAEAAARFRGGRLYANGDSAFAFPQQVILDRWLKGLTAADLALTPLTADMLPDGMRPATLDSLNAELAKQIGPNGEIRALSPGTIGKNFGVLLASDSFRQKHPEIARALALRVAVTCALEAITLDESFTYTVKPTVVLKPGQTATFWNTGYRNNWLNYHEAHLANVVSKFAPEVEAVMPVEVVKAWHEMMDIWVLALGNSSQGECSNQWCMILSGMAGVQRMTGGQKLLDIINERISVMTDPLGLGRTNPLTPSASLGSVAGFGFASDTGMTGAGILADGFGFDAEYDLEQIKYIHNAWNVTHSPDLLRWFNSDYELKTLLSVPWKAGAESSPYSGIVSPTDLNHRTTFATHKSDLPADAVDQVRYGLLWQPQEGKTSPESWPFLDKESWTKSIDNRFHFLNRGPYYAIVYTGESLPDWSQYKQAESTVKENDGILTGSVSISGYGGMHYKGLGRKATKPGGISALYLKDFGTALLSQNSDIPYTNTVWGKRKTPISPVWEEGYLDPYVVAATYDADPLYENDAEHGIFTKQERMRYAPVLSSRRLTFDEDGVQVELEVTALDDLDLTELYESLPLITRSRSLVFVGEDGGRTTVDPEATAPRELSKEKWKIKAIELTDESGRGMRATFSQPVEVRLVGTVEYEGKPMSAAVQVILNGAARLGDVQRVAYTLTSRKEP